jgi:hypothetical protein
MESSVVHGRARSMREEHSVISFTLQISKNVGPYILFHKFRLTVSLAIFD